MSKQKKSKRQIPSLKVLQISYVDVRWKKSHVLTTPLADTKNYSAITLDTSYVFGETAIDQLVSPFFQHLGSFISIGDKL